MFDLNLRLLFNTFWWGSDNNFLFVYALVGLELLLELFDSTNLKHKRDGSAALCKLANKASSLSQVDAAPPSPVPQVCLS